jgi:hypothetical protein
MSVDESLPGNRADSDLASAGNVSQQRDLNAKDRQKTSYMSPLPPDILIAQLVNGLYAYPGYAPVAFDHIEQPGDDDGICFALKRVAGTDIIVLRGSTTQQDWLRDFEAVADPFGAGFIQHFFGFPSSGKPDLDTALGPCHPGFLAGMDAAYAAMQSMLGESVIVCGHSLGAGRAAILTGLMVAAGKLPRACVTFGQPRPGFPQLAKLISAVPQRSYCNGSADGIILDMVTEVPVALGPEDYVHPHPLTRVCEEPNVAWFEKWGIFAYHGMPLYLAALEKLAGLPPSAPVGAPLVARGGLAIH